MDANPKLGVVFSAASSLQQSSRRHLLGHDPADEARACQCTGAQVDGQGVDELRQPSPLFVTSARAERLPTASGLHFCQRAQLQKPVVAGSPVPASVWMAWPDDAQAEMPPRSLQLKLVGVLAHAEGERLGMAVLQVEEQEDGLVEEAVVLQVEHHGLVELLSL